MILSMLLLSINILFSQEKIEYKIKSDGEFEYSFIFLNTEIKGIYQGEYYKSKIDGEKYKIPHRNGVLKTVIIPSTTFKSGNLWHEGKLNGNVIIETSKWSFEGNVINGDPVEGKIIYHHDLNSIDANYYDKLKVSYQGKFFNHLYSRGELKFASKKSYEGDFVNGIFEGNGILSIPNNLTYKGNFINGLFEGNGLLTLVNNTTYEGGFKVGKFEGKGVYIQNDTKITGDFQVGKINGNALVNYKNGNVYDGLVMNYFTPNGIGKMSYANGDVEDGTWIEGKFVNGKARYTINKIIWEGNFINHKPIDSGQIIYPDGILYAGEWSSFGDIHDAVNQSINVRTKNGYLLLADKSKYTGFFSISTGIPNGQGVLLLPNGQEKKGNFKAGVLERILTCNEVEIKTKESIDPEIIKTCTWGDYKSVSTGNADYKGRYYYSYQLFKTINTVDVSISNEDFITKDKINLMNFLQHKVNESFNRFAKDKEHADCFIDVEKPKVEWETFGIEFTVEGVQFSYKFGLQDACLASDGDSILLTYDEISRYIQ